MHLIMEEFLFILIKRSQRNYCEEDDEQKENDSNDVRDSVSNVKSQIFQSDHVLEMRTEN